MTNHLENMPKKNLSEDMEREDRVLLQSFHESLILDLVYCSSEMKFIFFVSFV